MKIKVLVIAVICVILAGFALGATGLVNLAPESVYFAADRMIGVFITYEPLFEPELDFSSIIGSLQSSGSDELIISPAPSATDRIYAKAVEKTEIDPKTGVESTHMDFVFEGLEGFGFFGAYVHPVDGKQPYFIKILCGDEGVCHPGVRHDNNEAGPTAMSLFGTVYFAKIRPEFLYPNPVYETPSGEVYVRRADESLYTPQLDGSSYRISENQTFEGYDYEVDVSLSFEKISAADTCTVKQFDCEDRLLSREDLDTAALPESIDALPNAEYIIVESKSGQGDDALTTRTVCDRSDDSSYFSLYLPMENGICSCHSCTVDWGTTDASLRTADGE